MKDRRGKIRERERERAGWEGRARNSLVRVRKREERTGKNQIFPCPPPRENPNLASDYGPNLVSAILIWYL